MQKMSVQIQHKIK